MRTVGVTDLHSYFIDRSIYLESSLQKDLRVEQGVFILSHLLDFVDEYQKEADIYLYHPGDEITVTGYFLNNSGNPSNVYMSFTSFIDDTRVAYS